MIHIQDLGSGLDFETTWKKQQDLALAIREGGERETLFLLEHAPVYTIGRTRDQSSLLQRDSLPHPVIVINRGGQATFHGPGQLVGYAVLDLKNHHQDLHLHLRRLEEVLLLTLNQYGVRAQRREGLTGVWIDDRKIASLGVGVRKWISQHGFAINIASACLPPFQAITPCGLSGVQVTSLETELGEKVSIADFKNTLCPIFQRIFATHPKTSFPSEI